MILESGLHFLSIPKQFNCELDLNFYNISSNHSGSVGLSGNSFVGFQIYNGVVKDTDNNFITSIGNENILNLKSLLFTGLSVNFSEQEVLSSNNISNVSGYQYFVYNFNKDCECNVKILGLQPNLSGSLINNFSGDVITSVTGYINNLEPNINFQVTGLEVISPSSYYIDSFNSGIISNSGQFVIKNYYPDLPYSSDEIVLRAKTNFGDKNFQLSHSPFNNLGSFNSLNISPFISSKIKQGSYKTFTIDSRYNYPIQDKQIDVSFLLISGGQPNPYTSYNTVNGSGRVTGHVTGSGEVYGYMSGMLSGTGFVALTGVPFVFTGLLTGSRTGTLSGRINNITGHTQPDILLENYPFTFSNVLDSGYNGVINQTTKIVSGTLGHEYYTISGLSYGEGSPYDGVVDIYCAGASVKTEIENIIPNDLFWRVRLPVTVASLSAYGEISASVSYESLNFNNNFLITSANRSGATSPPVYTGKLTGFYTGGIIYGIPKPTKTTGDWIFSLNSTNSEFGSRFNQGSGIDFKILTSGLNLNTGLSNTSYKDYRFDTGIFTSGYTPNDEFIFKKSFSLIHNENKTMSGDLPFRFEIVNRFSYGFTGLQLHSYTINNGSGNINFFPTKSLSSNGSYNITRVTNYSGWTGNSRTKIDIYTGVLSGIFNNTNISGTHTISFKLNGLTISGLQQMSGVKSLDINLAYLSTMPTGFNYSTVLSGEVNATGQLGITGLYNYPITTGTYIVPEKISIENYFNVKTGKSEARLLDFKFNNLFNPTGFINSGNSIIAKPIQFNRSFIQIHNLPADNLSGQNVLKMIANDGDISVEYLVTGDVL